MRLQCFCPKNLRAPSTQNRGASSPLYRVRTMTHRPPSGTPRKPHAFPLGLRLRLPAHPRPAPHKATSGAPCGDAGADGQGLDVVIGLRGFGVGISVRHRQPHGMAARAHLCGKPPGGIEVISEQAASSQCHPAGTYSSACSTASSQTFSNKCQYQ